MPKTPAHIIKLTIYVILVAIFLIGLFQLIRSGQRASEPDSTLNLVSDGTLLGPIFPRLKLETQPRKNTSSSQNIFSSLTYRPQQVRPLKQYSGLLGPDGSVIRSAAGWWLYANSQAEAEWLDYFGYPTPSEELMLASMSDSALNTLVSSGDLNAKSHQVARMTDEIFKSENTEKTRTVEGLLGRLLVEGGPYQAFTICRVYSELLQSFQDLPPSEQTSKRRGILESVGRSAQLAYELGSAYDDHTMMELQNGYIAGLREQIGVAAIENRTSVALSRTLASIAARRSEINVSPIVLRPRPETPRSASFVPLERY